MAYSVVPGVYHIAIQQYLVFSAGAAELDEDGVARQFPPPRDGRRANPSANTDLSEQLPSRTQLRRELVGLELEEEEAPIDHQALRKICLAAYKLDTSHPGRSQDQFDRYAEQLVTALGIDYTECFLDEHRLVGLTVFRNRAKKIMEVSQLNIASVCGLKAWSVLWDVWFACCFVLSGMQRVCWHVASCATGRKLLSVAESQIHIYMSVL